MSTFGIKNAARAVRVRVVMPDKPLRSIHVVAGIVTDARDRILLSRRTESREMAGLWEFPGGKREPGETSEEALIRELREELGIEAEVGECVMEVPQLYPDKRLRLEVRKVTRWHHRPRGKEGQALAWVAADKLSRYSMPPADRPVVAALRQPDRYLVTPEPGTDEALWLQQLSTALALGVSRIQLRARTLSSTRWRALISRALAMCQLAGAEVLINRDIELADAFGVGVHLSSEQLRQCDRLPMLSAGSIAASCHNAEELQKAQQLGCAFVVLGPVKSTPSHPESDAVLGWEGFARLRENISLPIYAIGGLSEADLYAARKQGAQGVAAIRGLWPA